VHMPDTIDDQSRIPGSKDRASRPEDFLRKNKMWYIATPQGGTDVLSFDTLSSDMRPTRRYRGRETINPMVICTHSGAHLPSGSTILALCVQVCPPLSLLPGRRMWRRRPVLFPPTRQCSDPDRPSVAYVCQARAPGADSPVPGLLPAGARAAKHPAHRCVGGLKRRSALRATVPGHILPCPETSVRSTCAHVAIIRFFPFSAFPEDEDHRWSPGARIICARPVALIDLWSRCNAGAPDGPDLVCVRSR
jgi:hypothetical protein